LAHIHFKRLGKGARAEFFKRKRLCLMFSVREGKAQSLVYGKIVRLFVVQHQVNLLLDAVYKTS